MAKYRTVIAATIAFGLTACASPAFKVAINEAATAADVELAAATFAMCRAITVGAWVRAYGADAAKAEAWRALCAAPVTQLPAK